MAKLTASKRRRAARPSWPTLRDSFTRSNGRSFRHTQVADDCDPAIIAVRRLRAAPVSASLQGSVQLAFDHGLDEAAHPIRTTASIGSNQSSKRYTAVSAAG